MHSRHTIHTFSPPPSRNVPAYATVHRDTVKRVLDAMIEVEPPPPWPFNPHIFVFGLDQCNHWQVAVNSKKGHFRGAERLNNQGMPIHIRSETVVNSAQRHVPFTLGMLTPDEVKLIREKGPYTEDYSNVLAALEPVVVKKQLWEGMEEMLELVEDTFKELDGVLSTREAERRISEDLLGRPKHPGGKTQIHIPPSIPNCDTKAFKDVFKFIPFLVSYCMLSMICLVVHADGQTVEILRACKRRWPLEYKPVVIAQGYFHALVHFIFCINFGFWQPLLCTFAAWLHKDKQIYEEMKDLQNDNATHALDFHRVSSAGILCYLLLSVKNPPPSLFVSDPQLYLTMVNQGGIAIIQYLLHGGSPILRYQRAIRMGKGYICRQMMAYSVHVHRSLAFKTKSVLINMTCLMGMCCTHPKIQQVLEVSGSISLFGDFMMAFDRFIEYINNLQLKRATAFRGYDSQLCFTKYLKALVHVDAVWKEVDGPGHRLDDGIPSYLYNDIAQIHRKLVETLGTDLTVASLGNPLWHTGIPVPLNGGDYRKREPWTYIWEVALGRSAGWGRSLTEAKHWRIWARKWYSESMFPM